MRKSACFISQLSHAGKMSLWYSHHSHILCWDCKLLLNVWEKNLLKGPLPRAPSHSLRWHCCTSQPVLSFPQREVTSKQTKQTKQNRTKTNRKFISQNQRSGKIQGWILFELTGWSSLRTIFLGGFLLLASDPAPIKLSGDVVTNNPQNHKRVRCLHQRPCLFFTL